MVIVGAMHIGMVERQTGLSRQADRLAVKTMLEDRLQAAVGRRADGDGTIAGRFEALVAEPFSHS